LSKPSHSFAISAYRESEHLPECLQSLLAQTVPSKVFIATSTPNSYLENVAARFGVPLFVGNHESGIGRDWNYAYSLADTDYVTITHQDDLYAPTYTEKVLAEVQKSTNPIFIYTDYAELRGNEIVANNTLLRIKRLLNSPLKTRFGKESKIVRNRVFSLGCPISTPSVAYNRNRFPTLQFDEEMATNLDWDMWQRLSEEEGTFGYIPEVLVLHRVHPDSGTSAGLAGGFRQAEDYEMYRRYWPEGIAKVLATLYAKSYSSNG
jgi:glycosyltransferase involved in cell wall biosynthesis